MQADNSRLAALSGAHVNQAEHERRKLQTALESEYKRVAELTGQLEASRKSQVCC